MRPVFIGDEVAASYATRFLLFIGQAIGLQRIELQEDA
jgi:hypothetical protein